ncbi:MAG TPA: CPBP family intramembrane glutamic endopeptidase [Polyangia bacterium]|nr:CPBP family intramembrane glutamic endopeptidase [Polyangia bacterium]
MTTPVAPRPSNQERLLATAAAAAYVAAMFVATPAVLALVVALAGIALWGGLARPSAWAVASFGAIGCALHAIPGFGATWPLPLLVALASWVLLVRRAPEGLALAVWFPRGRPDRVTWTLTVVFVVVASVALVTWFRLFRPDVSDLAERIPAWPVASLILLGVAFSMANALAEELVYRGILFGALERVWGTWPALVMQAVAFGLAHLHGFPRGWFGVALATVYGLMTGILRVRSRGLVAPLIAHVAADATIFAILVTLAR